MAIFHWLKDSATKKSSAVRQDVGVAPNDFATKKSSALRQDAGVVPNYFAKKKSSALRQDAGVVPNDFATKKSSAVRQDAGVVPYDFAAKKSSAVRQDTGVVPYDFAAKKSSAVRQDTGVVPKDFAMKKSSAVRQDTGVVRLEHERSCTPLSADDRSVDTWFCDDAEKKQRTAKESQRPRSPVERRRVETGRPDDRYDDLVEDVEDDGRWSGDERREAGSDTPRSRSPRFGAAIHLKPLIHDKRSGLTRHLPPARDARAGSTSVDESRDKRDGSTSVDGSSDKRDGSVVQLDDSDDASDSSADQTDEVQQLPEYRTPAVTWQDSRKGPAEDDERTRDTDSAASLEASAAENVAATRRSRSDKDASHVARRARLDGDHVTRLAVLATPPTIAARLLKRRTFPPAVEKKGKHCLADVLLVVLKLYYDFD